MSDLVRSFIAVKVPPESAECIRSAQERLRAADRGVKWVDPDSLHITLKFLGGVERERLREVWRTTAETLNGSKSFAIRFRGVGVFPNLKRPRVVWAGITEGGEELAELAARVEAACERHGFERERRAFRPHITLGRVRGSDPGPALAEAVTDQADDDLGEALVDRALLMKSELTRAGARYSVLEEVLLS